METKICTKCGKELSIEEFNWRDKSKGTRRSECKYCHSNYMKKQYQYKKNIFEQQKAQQTCVKCGESRGYVLDFHHLDPSKKEETVARMTSNKYNVEDIQKEVDKCIVLCANCHREFHHFEKLNNLTIEEYLNSGLV